MIYPLIINRFQNIYKSAITNIGETYYCHNVNISTNSNNLIKLQPNYNVKLYLFLNC